MARKARGRAGVKSHWFHPAPRQRAHLMILKRRFKAQSFKHMSVKHYASLKRRLSLFRIRREADPS
jgi:hypothetical protein